MGRVMMQLGQYQFGIDTAAHQSLRRSAEYRWPRQERIGREPAAQFMGPGAQSIDIRGLIVPEFRGGLRQVDRMRAEADRGEPLILVDGLGNVLGKWVIESVSEEHSHLAADGHPRKIDFSLRLSKYGEDL